MNPIGLLALLLSYPFPVTSPATTTPPAGESPRWMEPYPHDDGWPCPEEISVAEAYNRLYRTRYDERTRRGLARLRKEHGGRFDTTWNIDVLRAVRLVAYDTSGTGPIELRLDDGRRIELFAASPWTEPTRGWMPAGEAIVDLEVLLRRHGVDPAEASFEILVGDTVLSPVNTFLLEGKRRGEALLCFNDNGTIDGGDADGNEPILQIFTWAAEESS